MVVPLSVKIRSEPDVDSEEIQHIDYNVHLFCFLLVGLTAHPFSTYARRGGAMLPLSMRCLAMSAIQAIAEWLTLGCVETALVLHPGQNLLAALGLA